MKFVTPKAGDAVAVVARSVEAKVEEAEGIEAAPEEDVSEATDAADVTDVESPDAASDVTIETERRFRRARGE